MQEISTFIQDYSAVDMALRLLASVIFGFIIGFEREFTNKWAGLKTHILVALGSTVFTILSIYSFPKIAITGAAVAVGDPARVAAQILTGIGFIGGGTVLRHGTSIYGLTTAASLWMAASIGMAAGTGDYLLATFATMISVIVLMAIRKFQNIFIKPNRKSYAVIRASIIVKEDFLDEVLESLTKEFSNLLELKKRKSQREEDDLQKITIKFEVYDKDPLKKAYKKFNKIDNIETVLLEQDLNE